MSNLVLITATNFSQNCAAAKALLVQAGFAVLENPYGRPMTPEERAPYFQDICAVITGADLWDAAILRQCPKLRVIGRFGVGVDNIDLDAAKSCGIQVMNARGANADAVAELALCGILSVLRNVVGLDRSTRQGRWERYVGRTLRGKNVGLMGFGAIAQYLAKLLQPFSASVFAYDLFPDVQAAQRLGVTLTTQEAILETCDVISLHVPHTPQTENMIHAGSLARMKPGAILVNTARGMLVDEAALYAALQTGHLGGAVLDVHATEPTAADNPLFGLETVLVLPHTAAETLETYHSIGLLTAQAVVDVIKHGKAPVNLLNG